MSSVRFDLQGLFTKMPGTQYDIEPKDMDRMVQRHSRLRLAMKKTRTNRVRLAKLHWTDLQKLIAGMTDSERMAFLELVAKR